MCKAVKNGSCLSLSAKTCSILRDMSTYFGIVYPITENITYNRAKTNLPFGIFFLEAGIETGEIGATFAFSTLGTSCGSSLCNNLCTGTCTEGRFGLLSNFAISTINASVSIVQVSAASGDGDLLKTLENLNLRLKCKKRPVYFLYVYW